MKIKDTIHFQWYKSLFIVLIIALCFFTSANLTSASFTEVFSNLDQMVAFLKKLSQPDFSYIPELLMPMLKTLKMSALGTVIGMLFAIPCSFLATTVVTKNSVITNIFRLFLNVVRTIPNLLLAAILVAVIGIGEATGVITIAVFTFGLVSQLIYESIETIDYAPIEANESVGANKVQIAVWSIWPQILLSVISYFFYAFEINVRASTVLGYVGAGGIGVTLNAALGLFRYDRVSIIIISIFIVVLIVDAISETIRRKLEFNETKQSKMNGWLVIAIIIIILAFCAYDIDWVSLTYFSWGSLKATITSIMNPEWSFFYNGSGEDVFSLMVMTICIAFVGTTIGTILCFPFVLIASKNLWNNNKIIPRIGKFILDVLRSFPELVYAIIFIKVVGPGPFAGVLAIGVHQIGMLGKLFAEEMEQMDEAPVEASQAVGANSVQTMFYARIPQLMPIYASLVLNHFEIGVRSASTLGLVGAGGIGAALIFAIQARKWSRVGIILLVIIVTVFLLDLLTGYIRKKLR